MEFEIYRTSDHFKENKPCDKAYVAGKDKWDRPIYKIKIDTLDDLIALIEEVDENLILNNLSIEIYDDWRE